jgi:hypothetical protein
MNLGLIGFFSIDYFRVASVVWTLLYKGASPFSEHWKHKYKDFINSCFYFGGQQVVQEGI